MKRILLLALLLLLLAGAGALYMSFMPEKLAVDSLPKVLVPAAHPPAAMRLYAIEAGKMISQAAFTYRGGRFGEQRNEAGLIDIQVGEHDLPRCIAKPCGVHRASSLTWVKRRGRGLSAVKVGHFRF